MIKEIINGIIKLLLVINTSIFIISFSITFVILFRPFYYIHIEETGYSYKDIKFSYDKILDYTSLNKKFSTGVFKYSKDGYNHFRDCKKLFNINFILVIISLIIIIIQKIKFKSIKIFNKSIEFISSILNILIFIILFIFILIYGFDNSFTLFHNIFFKGKDNWLFNPDTDPIINILPEVYFRNCGIFIITLIFIISIVIIIKELFIKRKEEI